MENKYVSEFQIIGTSVKNLRIKNDFIVLENDNRIKRKFDLSHFVSPICEIEEGKILSGTVTLNVSIKISNNKKRYKLDMSIEGCFNAPAKIEKEAFSELLQINGLAALYSIARGIVQSVSSQTLVCGSVLLPMVNVLAYSKSIKEDEVQ